MCGIAAYVGSGGGYSPIILKLLALLQDSRGGDSAGFGYFDNTNTPTIHKGAPVALPYVFKNVAEIILDTAEEMDVCTLLELLCYYKKLPDTLEQDTAILIHSRKATLGLIDLDNAHPFYFDGNIPLIMCHNGTAKNYKALLVALNLAQNTTNSDSKTLGYILTAGKLDTLFLDMDNAGNLVWIEREFPDILNVICTGVGAKTDRELHYLCRKDLGTYISSAKSPLLLGRALFLDPDSEEIIESPTAFASNTWYKIQKDKVTIYKVFEKKEIPTKTANKPVYSSVPSSTSIQIIKEDITGFTNSDIVYYWKFLYYNRHKQKLHTSFVKKSNAYVPLDNYLFTDKGRIVQVDGEGKYYFNLNINNVETQEYLKTGTKLYTMYFVHGILMKNKEEWENLLHSHSNPRILSAAVLCTYAKYPVPVSIHDQNNPTSGYFFLDGVASYFTHEVVHISPIFSNKYLTFENGFVVKLSNISRKNATILWDKESFSYLTVWLNTY